MSVDPAAEKFNCTKSGRRYDGLAVCAERSQSPRRCWALGRHSDGRNRATIRPGCLAHAWPKAMENRRKIHQIMKRSQTMKKLTRHVRTRIILAVALFAASFTCVCTAFARSNSCLAKYNSDMDLCNREKGVCERAHDDHQYCFAQWQACSDKAQRNFNNCIR